MLRVPGIVLALALASCGASQHARPTPAELVLRGGDVITMDDDAPRATAVAIAGGRIVAVGDDAAIASWIGPTTRVIELAGRTVTLNDRLDYFGHTVQHGATLLLFAGAGEMVISDDAACDPGVEELQRARTRPAGVLRAGPVVASRVRPS